MSNYLNRQEGQDMQFVESGNMEDQEWGGYQGYASNYRQSSAISQEEDAKRLINSRPEAVDNRLAGRFISAISNVSGGSDDGYKNRYVKVLKELNNVIDANNKIKNELIICQNKLHQFESKSSKNSLINSQMQQLRQINQKLQNELKNIVQINKECQFEIEQHKSIQETQRKQIERLHQVIWKLEGKDQEIYSLKDGYERQLENLSDTINKLQMANSAFKTQQSNLKQMYGGKQQANLKKISYLQSQLQQTKAQLTKEREKINTQIQGMSMRIRKQTQSELANYKLQMNKLKDINIESQRENERLNKELRQLSDRRADKKSYQQRHISQLQQNVQNCKKQIRRLKQTLSNTHNIEIQKQSLQKQVKVLQQYNHNLTQQSADAKARSASLKTSNEQLINTNTRLEGDIQKLKIQNQKLQAQIKRKQAIINRQKSESDTLKSKVVKLEVEHTKNNGSGSRGNIFELQDRIKQLKTKVNLPVGKKIFQQDRQDMERDRIQSFNSLTSAIEQKMQILVQENQQINKRLLHYKQKCNVIQKKYDSSNNEMKVLATKVEKYQNFVPKLENQLERVIKQSQYGQPATSSQYLNPSQNLMRQKLKQMNDRLVLESKYAKQQLETKCLQYDSKLVSAKLEISKLKQALKGESFFHNRITQLSQKLSDTENKKLQLTKKVGDLQRQRLLSERMPISYQKQLQASRNSNRQVQQLKSQLLQKDRQIARISSSISSNIYSHSNNLQFQKNELLTQISQLKTQNRICIQLKEEAEERVLSLQNELLTIKQSNIQSNYQPKQTYGQSFDQIERLRNQNDMLRRFEKSYFELEQKSSIIIKTFEQFKLRYESISSQNIFLKQENQTFKIKELEHNSKIENMQQMFDVVYKRLQQSLYQNNELLSENSKLKGVTIVTTQQIIQNVPYGTSMSTQEKILIEDGDNNQYESAPQQNETARFEIKQAKKQFQTALFGSNSDNSYEMEFKSDDHYGEYY